MKFKKVLAIILIGMLVMASLAGCTAKVTDVNIMVTLRKGFPYNEFIWNSANLALEEWNGEMRHPVKVHLVKYEYDGESPTIAADYAAAISQYKPVAVIGSFFSKDVLAIYDEIARSGIPYLTQGTSTQLTKKGVANVFRLQSSDETMCRVAVKYIGDVIGKRKVALLYANTVFGNGGKEDLTKAAAEFGVDIVSSLSYDPKSSSISTQIHEINTSGAEMCILWPDFGDYALIHKSFTEEPLNIPFFSNQGMQSMIENGYDVSPYSGSYVMFQFMYLGAHAPWVEKYEDRYGKKPMSEEYPVIYDAMHHLLLCIDDMKDPVSAASIAKTLRELHYEGVSGMFLYDRAGEGLRQAYISQFNSGNLEFVKVEVLDSKD